MPSVFRNNRHGAGDEMKLLIRTLEMETETVVIHNFEPKVLNQSISKETAAQLLELLSENVKTGTAQNLALDAVPVAGMAASKFSGSNHLWMVALAPVTRPEVVVAVLLEGDGSDDQDTAEATVAAITRRITEAVLRLSSSNLGGS